MDVARRQGAPACELALSPAPALSARSRPADPERAVLGAQGGEAERALRCGAGGLRAGG